MEDQSYKMQPQTAAEKKTQLRKEISLAIEKAAAVSGNKLLFFFSWKKTKENILAKSNQ